MRPRVSYLVKRVERGIRSELDAALEPLGVSTPEYTALSVLRARSGLSSAQLARRAFVSGQAMNQIVISLERRGWLEREPDPLRAKILRARLTRQGSDELRDCDRATAYVERALLADLTPGQADTLRKALETCADSLARIHGEGRESKLEP
jgi:DNA-binding MarR family transcriptional regulator